MKKYNLKLNYPDIIARIENEREFQELKPGKWADKVGVTINVVSNIHGKTKQKPSLEYIIAVSRATQKPVEYFLYGEDINKNRNEVNEKGPIGDLLSMTKEILVSNTDYATSLSANIKSFHKSVTLEKNKYTLEDECKELKKEVKDLKNLIHEHVTGSASPHKNLKAGNDP